MPPKLENNSSNVTSHQVARAAGVSVGTVIRVLNAEPKVDQTLREKVLKVIDELGYVYIPKKKASHSEANGLKNLQKVKTLLFCVPFQTDDPLQNGYFYPILRGASRECSKYGINLVYSLLKDADAAVAEAQQMVKSGHADGILLVNYSSQVLIKDLLDQGVPVLLIDPRQPEGLKVDVVVSDVFGGLGLAIEHLGALGHQHIALINGAPRYGMQRRLDGYKAGLAKAGIAFNPELVVVAEDGLPGSGKLAIQTLQERKLSFSAIICAQDRLAYEVISVLNASRVRVPHEISVVGIDNHDASAAFSPPLTTVEVYAENKGSLAVRRLIERIANPTDPTSWSLLQVRLLERSSTAWHEL